MDVIGTFVPNAGEMGDGYVPIVMKLMSSQDIHTTIGTSVTTDNDTVTIHTFHQIIFDPVMTITIVIMKGVVVAHFAPHHQEIKADIDHQS